LLLATTGHHKKVKMSCENTVYSLHHDTDSVVVLCCFCWATHRHSPWVANESKLSTCGKGHYKQGIVLGGRELKSAIRLREYDVERKKRAYKRRVATKKTSVDSDNLGNTYDDGGNESDSTVAVEPELPKQTTKLKRPVKSS